MVKQRLTEWENHLENDLGYYLNQWETPKQSTIHFSNFIRNKIKNSKIVIDIGCGMGGSTHYISKQFPKSDFIGIDINEELIKRGNLKIKESGQVNIRLKQGDWFNLQKHKNIDGVISLQTLSWLPEWEKPIDEILNKLKPNWVCLTSLFHEGDISIKSEVFEHSINKVCYYNTYSIPSIKRFVNKYGYSIEKYEPFEIDIDIPKPNQLNRMSTYTVLTKENKRLQISGPLLMNWYCLIIVKDK